MGGFLSISPLLAPVIGCAIGLLGLWLGWSTLRARTLPRFIVPLIRVNLKLAQMIQGEQIVLEKANTAPRIYGWAFIYAGALALIVAGSQLLGLLALVV